MIRSRQHGWSLMEMLVVISLSSVITGLIVTLLATLFQHNQRTARLSNEAVSLDRLFDQFRADVRIASSINNEQHDDDADGSVQIVLTLADNARVVYQQQGDRLTRSFSQAEQPNMHESYFLPEGSRIELNESPSGVGEMATLMLDYPIRPELGSKHRHRLITATLGRDLDWTSADKGNEP